MILLITSNEYNIRFAAVFFIMSLENKVCICLNILVFICWHLFYLCCCEEAGAAGLLLVLVLIYFPDKPPVPPSLSAATEREEFRPGLAKLIRWDYFDPKGSLAKTCNIVEIHFSLMW